MLAKAVPHHESETTAQVPTSLTVCESTVAFILPGFLTKTARLSLYSLWILHWLPVEEGYGTYCGIVGIIGKGVLTGLVFIRYVSGLFPRCPCAWLWASCPVLASGLRLKKGVLQNGRAAVVHGYEWGGMREEI